MLRIGAGRVGNRACAVVGCEALRDANPKANGAMASEEKPTRTDHEAEAKAGIVESAPPDASWLPRHKVELPDPIEGYLRRPEVDGRCELTGHRVTVLHAPGGFGKTALLARRCRALRERGLAVAWLSVDEEDGPESVARLLALAFERTGVATFDPAGERRGPRPPGRGNPEAASRAEYRIGLLIRALERHGEPCVLALDEVERLRSPEAVRLINALVLRAPPHLHVGMAFRERPPGLAIDMYAIEGRGVTVTVEHLRFSKSDISRFFGGSLSRRKLAVVVHDTAGWPLALRIHHDATEAGAPHAAGGEGALAGWIETRLWRGFSAEDRDFVLDIALFDRLETNLIDEVTDTRNTGRRIASMGALAGLLSTTGRGSTMRLHPLIRRHCEQRRFEEAPERFRDIHRGIAVALARRGRSIEALRHAAEAADTALLGSIAERAGGVRLWFEHGFEALCALDGVITEAVVSDHPRLALVRCGVHAASGDIEGANRLYRATAAQTAGFTRDREGGDDRALRTDHLFIQGLLYTLGCIRYDDALMEGAVAVEALAGAPDTDPLLRGMFSLGMCLAHNQMTEFNAAVEWAGRARASLGRASPYLAHVDLQAGSVAMARGHVRQARRCYDRALQLARSSHLRDAGAVMLADVLAAELDFERTAGAPRSNGPRVSPRLLGQCGAWLDIYAAGIGVGAETALLRAGPEAALALVEDARDYARSTERPQLARFLSALRVSVLLDGGQVDEAARTWRFDGLPERRAEYLVLTTQSWREMEMLACVRLRLLVARGEFDTAREIAVALLAVASRHALVRTRMRGLALSMLLEHCAGRSDHASAHLVDYLRLYAETDYARPLSRDRAVALALLDDAAFAAADDGGIAASAGALRKALVRETGAKRYPSSDQALTEGELEVLARLEHWRDKDIARTLGLSYDGVRYRVRRIFAKLGARSRLDAVARARALGILRAEAEDGRDYSPPAG